MFSLKVSFHFLFILLIEHVFQKKYFYSFSSRTHLKKSIFFLSIQTKHGPRMMYWCPYLVGEGSMEWFDGV